jgi:hypothetical protein
MMAERAINSFRARALFVPEGWDQLFIDPGNLQNLLRVIRGHQHNHQVGAPQADNRCGP